MAVQKRPAKLAQFNNKELQEFYEKPADQWDLL
jgi:hypothetical protein